VTKLQCKAVIVGGHLMMWGCLGVRPILTRFRGVAVISE